MGKFAGLLNVYVFKPMKRILSRCIGQEPYGYYGYYGYTKNNNSRGTQFHRKTFSSKLLKPQMFNLPLLHVHYMYTKVVIVWPMSNWLFYYCQWEEYVHQCFTPPILCHIWYLVYFAHYACIQLDHTSIHPTVFSG